MKELLYKIMELIARIHQYIMGLNDAYEYDFTDKELHFLVVGIVGLLLIFIIYPLFKWLAKKHLVMVIAWIYVFTLVIGFSLAIEIGQKISGSGVMDFADIMFGVVGFLAMFLAFCVVRFIWHMLCRLVRKIKERIRANESEKHCD
ncbi:MAG: hypothetical protein IJZ00_12010 [Lachnospiraceae bacterium]|nr:hypothetical protein [Lachnospiraceae bacterium]MBQ8262994.1 hypothetical protein [Lachnospiraceae bacterium]